MIVPLPAEILADVLGSVSSSCVIVDVGSGFDSVVAVPGAVVVAGFDSVVAVLGAVVVAGFDPVVAISGAVVVVGSDSVVAVSGAFVGGDVHEQFWIGAG